MLCEYHVVVTSASLMISLCCCKPTIYCNEFHDCLDLLHSSASFVSSAQCYKLQQLAAEFPLNIDYLDLSVLHL